MQDMLVSLALLSLVASAQAAAIPRHLLRDAPDIAVAEILPDGTATATALLSDDGLLAHAIAGRDTDPLAGILSLVNGLLNGLDGILPAGVINATESALNTVAGLLLIANPNPNGAANTSQAQYVMAASANQSTPLFIVPADNTTTDATSMPGKTLVSIHVPILDEATGQMVDSCLTYDQDPVASSTLAALPCSPDTDHASQRYMYDSSTGIVEPMFSGAGNMDLASQTPSYMVNAANVDADDTPAANVSSVLIVFTPATDSVAMSTAAMPLSRVASAGNGAVAMASATGGSASAAVNGATASTSGDDDEDDADDDDDDINDAADEDDEDDDDDDDDEEDDQLDGATDISTDTPNVSDDSASPLEGQMPTQVAAAKGDECDEEVMNGDDS